MKPMSINTKHVQIKKASSVIFISVVIASIIVSFSLVTLNILWGNSKYNTKVQDKLTETRDTLKANLASVDSLETEFRSFESAAKLIPDQEESKANSSLVLDALPSKYDFPAIASSMANLATRSSVTLTAFDGQDLAGESLEFNTQPMPVEIPFTVTVEGPYTSIKEFVNNLQKSVRPMNVTTAKFSGTDTTLSATFEIITYYQPAFDTSITTEVVAE